MLLKEIKKFPRRPVDDSGEYGVNAGKYIGIRFTPDSKKQLRDIVDNEGIPNGIEDDDIHSTVAYSKKSRIPGYEPTGKFNEPEEAEIEDFDIFSSDDDAPNCLVAKLKAPTLVDRHNQTMKHGASYDYDEYIPHITLSYDAGDWSRDDLDNLAKKYKGTKVFADEEYENEILDDFSDKYKK